MVFAEELKEDVAQAIAYGDQVRLKYYTTTYGGANSYDDDVTYTQSGTNLWTSGLSQPIDNRPNGVDAILLEQGLLQVDDIKLYVEGVVQTSGLAPIKIGIGSPVDNEYQILNQGQVIAPTVGGEFIYKKIYARILNNGSFVGE